MFSITSSRYFLFSQPTDMRKSFDGLCGIVTDKLKQNPLSGDVFVFVNKPRNRIKLLRWETGGFVLFYKRLERGTFELPACSPDMISYDLDYGELAMIITGISLKNARKKLRFFPQKMVNNFC